MSLLDEAKKIKLKTGGSKSKIDYRSKEFQDVAIAWMKNEVSVTQLCGALDIRNSGSILYAIAIALRQAYREKRITIK